MVNKETAMYNPLVTYFENHTWSVFDFRTAMHTSILILEEIHSKSPSKALVMIANEFGVKVAFMHIGTLERICVKPKTT